MIYTIGPRDPRNPQAISISNGQKQAGQTQELIDTPWEKMLAHYAVIGMGLN